jgi:hypothetical protein
MPIYCESLRAGIFTCLKIIPKIWLVYRVAFSKYKNEYVIYKMASPCPCHCF